MHFEVIGAVRDVQVIAFGRRIRALNRLQKRYGEGRWRKLKGVATIRLASGKIREAELHWYEAHGIGKRGLKIKRFMEA
jgi:hypothetical protein